MNLVEEKKSQENFWLRLKNMKTAVFVLLLIFFGSILSYPIDLPNADDMARHIKNGQLILQGHWDILFKNVYSFTLPDQAFVNHHWFSGVIFYLLHLMVGWDGLVIDRKSTRLNSSHRH